MSTSVGDNSRHGIEILLGGSWVVISRLKNTLRQTFIGVAFQRNPDWLGSQRHPYRNLEVHG